MKLLVLALLLLLPALPVSAQETITIGSDQWLPYVGTHDNRGYMIDVADAVFREKGISVQIRPYPWARIIAMVRKGELTAAAGMQKSQAPDFIVSNEPLGVDEAAFFVRSTDPWVYKGIPSLAGKRLGVIKNYTYEKQIDRYVADNFSDPNKIHAAHGDDPYEQIVKVLQAGRVDMIIANPNVFSYKLHAMGLNKKDFRKIPIAGSASYVYIGFSPAHEKSKEYARMLSEGIVRLRKNGALEKILRRYDLKDWK